MPTSQTPESIQETPREPPIPIPTKKPKVDLDYAFNIMRGEGIRAPVSPEPAFDALDFRPAKKKSPNKRGFDDGEDARKRYDLLSEKVDRQGNLLRQMVDNNAADVQGDLKLLKEYGDDLKSQLDSVVESVDQLNQMALDKLEKMELEREIKSLRKELHDQTLQLQTQTIQTAHQMAQLNDQLNQLKNNFMYAKDWALDHAEHLVGPGKMNSARNQISGSVPVIDDAPLSRKRSSQAVESLINGYGKTSSQSMKYSQTMQPSTESLEPSQSSVVAVTPKLPSFPSPPEPSSLDIMTMVEARTESRRTYHPLDESKWKNPTEQRNDKQGKDKQRR
jgi:hypothetical protein